MTHDREFPDRADGASPRRPRRHHTVSKFYLSHFANDAGQVRTVEVQGGSSYQSIGDASVQTDFYTAVGLDGSPTDVAEAAFGRIEGEAAEAWRAVKQGAWPLPGDLRSAMASWIGLQLLRGPGTRRSMGDIGTHLFRAELIDTEAVAASARTYERADSLTMRTQSTAVG